MSYNGSVPRWPWFLAKFTDSSVPRMLLCPSMSFIYANEYKTISVDGLLDSNSYYLQYTPYGLGDMVGDDWNPTLASVDTPSGRMLIADAALNKTTNYGFYYMRPWVSTDNSCLDAVRHNRTVNTLFLDFHVEGVKTTGGVHTDGYCPEVTSYSTTYWSWDKR